MCQTGKNHEISYKIIQITKHNCYVCFIAYAEMT